MNEPLRKSVTVRCSPQHAFEVFTARLDSWWPPSHKRDANSQLTLEPRIGGRFVERAPAGEEHVLGEVLCWEPPERVVYTWFPGALEGPTRVEVQFSAEGPQTRVDVTHHEGDSELGEQWHERVQLFARAWAHVLPAFQQQAERKETP